MNAIIYTFKFIYIYLTTQKSDLYWLILTYLIFIMWFFITAFNHLILWAGTFDNTIFRIYRDMVLHIDFFLKILIWNMYNVLETWNVQLRERERVHMDIDMT